MYEFLKQHPGEVHTGVYYKSAPSIPMTETGKVFRYSEPDSASDENADVVANLEYRREQKTISTTFGYDWEPDTFVLLGNEVYRILMIRKRTKETPQVAMIRKPPVEYLLTLDKCGNPVGLSRV